MLKTTATESNILKGTGNTTKNIYRLRLGKNGDKRLCATVSRIVHLCPFMGRTTTLKFDPDCIINNNPETFGEMFEYYQKHKYQNYRSLLF